MASTLHRVSTDGTLSGFAVRHPEWFAVLTWAAYILALLAFLPLLSEDHVTTTGVVGALGQNAARVLVPAVLLTALGWWGRAGFTTRSTWRTLVPVLPLTLFVVIGVLPLVLGARIATHGPGLIALSAVTLLAVGFGEEATFRGVVLQTLLPRGTMRAVVISSILFAAMHLANVAAGMDLLAVAIQVLFAVGVGVGFAAVFVVTGTIWPLVVIHALMDIPAGFVEGTEGRPGIAGILIPLILGALAAAYGLWLLHRHHRKHADQSSQDEQMSPPQEPSAA